jgi:hypothetical protein
MKYLNLMKIEHLEHAGRAMHDLFESRVLRRVVARGKEEKEGTKARTHPSAFTLPFLPF